MKEFTYSKVSGISKNYTKYALTDRYFLRILLKIEVMTFTKFRM